MKIPFHFWPLLIKFNDKNNNKSVNLNIVNRLYNTTSGVRCLKFCYIQILNNFYPNSYGFSKSLLTAIIYAHTVSDTFIYYICNIHIVYAHFLFSQGHFFRVCIRDMCLALSSYIPSQTFKCVWHLIRMWSVREGKGKGISTLPSIFSASSHLSHHLHSISRSLCHNT